MNFKRAFFKKRGEIQIAHFITIKIDQHQLEISLID